MAAPTFADGGPHTISVMGGNGATTLAGDCANCHRAHTAQAADLLKSTQPGLCLACHDGTGATTDVDHGWQYVPSGDPVLGGHTSTILGALRGGGFTYALVGSPTRLSYNSRGGITVTFPWNSPAPANGTSFQIDWPAIGTFGAKSLTVSVVSDSKALQTTLQNWANDPAQGWGQTSTYYNQTTLDNLNNPTKNYMTVTVSQDKRTYTFAPHNEFRVISIPLPTVSNNNTGLTPAVANAISIGNTARITPGTAGSVTSSHEGTGTVWGNGPMGSGTEGAPDVELECTSCHNPHGNGQYRILNTLPGGDWTTSITTALSAAIGDKTTTTLTVTSSAGFPTVVSLIKIDSEQLQVTGGISGTTWTVVRGYNGTTAATHNSGARVTLMGTAPTNKVQIFDVGSTASTKNYTVATGTQANAIDTGRADYWRYKYDLSGLAGFTNFYLFPDPMNSGWNGVSATNADTIGNGLTKINMPGNAGATPPVPAGLTDKATTMTVDTPATRPFPATFPFYINVESETMQVTAISGSDWTVTRGVNGTTAAGHADDTNVTIYQGVLWNRTGLMTAWCISCHTRYNGYRVDINTGLQSTGGSAPSLYQQMPADATFKFKHGTTGVGCEQCHVSHGTNVTMDAASSTDTLTEDSALLKVANRGTCMLCHDPTGTSPAGTQIP